jgi:hypothetical protein
MGKDTINNPSNPLEEEKYDSSLNIEKVVLVGAAVSTTAVVSDVTAVVAEIQNHKSDESL